jgi:hypothetical protein
MMLAAAQPPERLGAHLLLAAVLALLLLAVVMAAVGVTRRRARRATSAMPELPAAPVPMPVALATPMSGVALGTTVPSGWQDAAFRGVLGSRCAGDLVVTCVGVAVAGLWLPRSALRSVRVDERFATKVMPGTGLVVIGWEWGGCRYESGFRGAASGYGEVLSAIRGLLDDETTADASIVKGARA